MLICVNPWLEEIFIGHLIKDWEKEFGCKLKIEFQPELPLENFQILDNTIDN